MDAQGPGAVDPADQWVLDPATGEYRWRTDQPPVPAEGRYTPAQPPADPASDGYAHQDTPAYGTHAAASDPHDMYRPHAAQDAYGTPGAYAGYEARGGYDDHGAYQAPGAHGAEDSGGAEGSNGADGYGEYARYDGYGTDGYGGSGYGDAGGTQAQTAAEPGAGAGAGAGAPDVPAPRAAAPGGRAAARASRRKPRGRTAVSKRTMVWSAGALGVVLVATGVGVALSQGDSGAVSVHAVDVGNAASPTVSMTGTMNILVISATGQGGSGTAGGSGAAGADSAILLHLSADRADATAVTIPGDLVTAIPDCPVKQANGTTKVVPGSPVKGASPTFAQSLGVQGRDPGCTMRTVDQLTGLKVDHFLLADARAVQELTTAAGGVDVCLKSPLSDPATHLDLSAGKHKLTAAQAPAFLTVRDAPPGHGDVDRARLQQAFVSALLRQWKGGGETARALGDAAARTLTVDPALARSGGLRTLAGEVGKPDITHDTFAALPVTAGSGGGAGASGATATLDRTAAAQLFSLMARDVPLSAGPAAPDPKLVGPKATPHDTRVTVLNGTGNFGASQDVLNWLQNEKGVNRSANGGDAPAALPETRLAYAPNQADQARSLAAMMGLPASALQEGTKNVGALTYMTLTLGKDYKAPGTPIALPAGPPKGLRTTTADSTTCVG